MVLFRSFFPSALTENICLENDVPMFVHYHDIINPSMDKNLDNNYGSFGVIYCESVNSSFMLYKFYLEGLCRGALLSYSACRKRSFCNRNFCAGTERKKIICIVIKETACFSLCILKLNNDCINIDFVNQIFNGYKKGVDYTSQNFDIENKINKIERWMFFVPAYPVQFLKNLI